MDDHSRPHRPATFADLTALIDETVGGAEVITPSTRAEIAAATAALVVQAGRSSDEPVEDRFVALVDRVGIDTLAALWRESDPVSLPGSLWALYLLRQWFVSSPDHVRLLWRAGAPLAPADAVVAGVAESGDVAALQDSADAILGGVFRGDVAVSLERAASMFRVLAAGRRDLDESPEEQALAGRNERVANDLRASAARWRAGTLR